MALAIQANAAAGSAGPVLEPALLDVSVNGQRSPEPLLLLRDQAGGLYASAALLRQWRIRLPAAAPLRFQDEDWYRIDTMPSLRTKIAEQDQSLAIEAGADLFERQTAELAASEQMDMTPAGTGGFVNYDLFLEHARGATSANGAFELGLFTKRGVGSATLVGSLGAGKNILLRLESGWTIDRPSSLTSIRIGDAVSSAGPGAVPVRFGGVQFGRNFAVQPGFVTMPLPALEGQATVPSVVDIYVNNMLQGSQQVNPGPFEVTNVPVQSGGGTVQIVTRDLLGREVVSEQSYYASSLMLRRGLHDFSYEAGFIRRGFGLRSNDYGSAMASTTHRYGITDHLTAEAHLQVSRSIQMAGAAATVSLGKVGLVGGSASVSRSRDGTGARVAGSFERRTSSLSFGVRSEYSTAAYAFIGIAEGERLPRMTTQAFADMPLLGGTVGLNFIHRDNRHEADERLAGIFGTFRAGRSVSVQIYARHAAAARRQTIVGAHAAFAFGGRRSASASVEHRKGAALGHLSYQKDPPPGPGGGYRVALTAGPVESADAVYTRNLSSASVTAHVGHAGGRSGVRLSAAGGIGLIGRNIFASRALGSSFAAVKVGEHRGVRVYADNQLVGVTDASGTAIIPAMRAFERNVIRIDEADLPMEVQLAASEVAIRPFARTGTLISFAAKSGRGALLQIRLEDGSWLPAGAMVQVEGDPEAHVTASAGEVYLPVFSGSARLRARWGGGSCSFSLAMPDNDDPQPRIEGLVCKVEPTYAAL